MIYNNWIDLRLNTKLERFALLLKLCDCVSGFMCEQQTAAGGWPLSVWAVNKSGFYRDGGAYISDTKEVRMYFRHSLQIGY